MLFLLLNNDGNTFNTTIHKSFKNLNSLEKKFHTFPELMILTYRHLFRYLVLLLVKVSMFIHLPIHFLNFDLI